MTDKNRILRAFPQIAVLLEDDEIKNFESRLSPEMISRLVKSTVSSLKNDVIRDTFKINDNYESRIKDEILRRFSVSAIRLTDLNYKRVINLSGIIMHSNLGRAVLPKGAVASLSECASGPVNLEMDMTTGKRVDRNLIVREKINFLFASEDSIVVNNNAAALLVICNSFAYNREILVSRGELVEIGGSFRLHEIIEASGAKVREVGTTNRTTAADFEKAIDANTAMILKIHPSNFYMKGYVHNTELAELGELAARHGIKLCYDMGTAVTGVFMKERKYQPQKAFKDGAHLVSFSGDKLLCGPQSGVILGNPDDIESIHKNPMFRALRCCKLTLTALETVLSEYIRDPETSPLINMLSQPLTRVLSKAESLKRHFLSNFEESFSMEIESGHTLIGSGVSPEIKYDTYILAISSSKLSAKRISEKFRNHATPVVGYINNERFCLDCRQIDFDIEKVFNREFFNIFK
jgi:L-seryl-tRNA(Ser) seleniumtransferase